MSLSQEAQDVLGLLKSLSGAIVKYVETYDRGTVAQVIRHGEGLLITEATVIQELIEAGEIAIQEFNKQHYVVNDGQKVAVPDGSILLNVEGQPVQSQPDSEQQFVPTNTDTPADAKAKGKK